MNRCIRISPLSLLLAAMFAVPAGAIDYFWDGTTGNYNTPTNWDPDYPGTPTTGDIMYVNNGGTCEITSPGMNTPTSLFAGATSLFGTPNAGTINQSGGAFSLVTGLRVGYQSGIGVYNMTGGTFTTTGGNANTNSLMVGQAVNPDPSELGAPPALGDFNMSGGAQATFVGRAHVGFAGGTGTIDLADTSILSTGGELRFGDAEGGSGTLVMSGSSAFNVGTVAYFGYSAGGTANVSMSGSSTLTTGGHIQFGAAETVGNLTMSGSSKVISGANIYFGHLGAGTTTSTIQMSGTTSVEAAGAIYIARASTGTVTMNNSARISATGTVLVGTANGGVGTLKMYGDNLSTDSMLTVGDTLAVGQSARNCVGWLELYNHTTATAATLNLANVTQVPTTVDPFCDGTINLHDSASLAVSGVSTIGMSNYSRGVMNLYEQSSFSTDQLIVGQASDGDGTINAGPGGVGTMAVNDNAVATTNELQVGHSNTGHGTVTISSALGTATLDVSGTMAVGLLGGDGNLIVGDGGLVNHTAGSFTIGSGTGWGPLTPVPGVGIVTMNGGTFDNALANGRIELGMSGGDGTWNHNGGTLLNNALGVDLGHDGGAATVNLIGGIFEAAHLRTVPSTTAAATINFNGGTLRATAATQNFIGDGGGTSVPQVVVHSGGARIDSNGHGIVVQADLMEDFFSTGGGLTKLGAGRLTLGGKNTYTGATAVEAGALYVGGSITSNVTVNDGAALMGSGTITGNVDLNGVFAVEFNGDTDTIDVLTITGALDLTGGIFSFSNVGVDPMALGTYVFATYGSLTGNPISSAGIPGDWTINYAYNGNNIALVVNSIVQDQQIPGDANGDQKVNDLDAKILAQHWGATTQDPVLTWWQMGDFDGNNFIDARDASIMAANWGYGVSSEATNHAVPEPGAIVLLFAAAVALAAMRRRK